MYNATEKIRETLELYVFITLQCLVICVKHITGFSAGLVILLNMRCVSC